MTEPPDDVPLEAGELEALLYFGCSSGTSTPPIVRSLIRRVVFELLDRRKRDLTSFEKIQLAHVRDRLHDITAEISVKAVLTKIIGDEELAPSLVMAAHKDGKL